MKSSPHIAIIGGGIMGCLTAYFLGRNGFKCIVIERDAIGSQASGAAAGHLSPLSGTKRPQGFAEFAIECHRIHRELSLELPAETGVDYHYTSTPFLRPAFNQKERDELEAQLPWFQQYDANPVWLEGQTLRTISKNWLSDEAQAAIYTSIEAQVEPYRLMVALAQAIEMQGNIVKAGEAVGLIKKGRRIVGIALADGSTVESDSFLLALGPWCKLAGSWVDLEIPVAPLRGQILKLSPPAALPEYVISYLNCYVGPKLAGYILAGTTEEEAGFERQVTHAGQMSITKNCLKLVPNLQNASLLEATSCLRPLSLDGVPIVGQMPEWDNLFIATGHGRKGILLSSGTCKYMAELMTTGHSSWDLSIFNPGRILE